MYVDLNASVNGNGLTPSTPKNVLPTSMSTNGDPLLFNSDNGIQVVPPQDNAVSIVGSGIEIGSYGSNGVAVVTGYQPILGGWTLVSGTVYSRSYAGALDANGFHIVGSVINRDDTTETPYGTILNWTDLTNLGTFDPTTLASGAYAYNYSTATLYVNIGVNPGSVHFGVAGVGRLLNVLSGNSPANIEVHNLYLSGFTRLAINAVRGSNNWHIHRNTLYGNGAMWTGSTYIGSGMQMSHSAHDIEVDNNYIIQTFDSPITPQHQGGSTGETIFNFNIHHNTIKKWGLAGVEISDFGTNNTTTGVTIQHNVIVGGGTGFSRSGDETGDNDCVHIRGDSASGAFSGFLIDDNTFQSANACFAIYGMGDLTDLTQLTNNNLSSSLYGVLNNRGASAPINGTGNTFCANTTDINGLAGVNGNLNGSTYSGNSTQGGQCYQSPPITRGVQFDPNTQQPFALSRTVFFR